MEEDCNNNHKWHKGAHHGSSQAVYGLGFIGAAVYFIQHATTFWMGAYGIVKAIFWPALLVFKALEHFKF